MSSTPSPDAAPILVVEDRADDAEFTLRALKAAGLAAEVVVARDGEEALEYLMPDDGRDGANGPLPRLVLLDVQLPKLDGFDVLKRIRANERTKFVPVVVFSSSDQPGDRLRSYELRANSYVHKPVAADEFSDAVVSIARFWGQLNLPAP